MTVVLRILVVTLVRFHRLPNPTLWTNFGFVILARERWMFRELFLAFRTALELENLISQSFWQCL